MNQNRWEFRIESEKVEGKVVEEAVKEEKKIRAEIRDVIRWGYKTQDILSTVLQADNCKCDLPSTPGLSLFI